MSAFEFECISCHGKKSDGPSLFNEPQCQACGDHGAFTSWITVECDCNHKDQMKLLPCPINPQVRGTCMGGRMLRRLTGEEEKYVYAVLGTLSEMPKQLITSYGIVTFAPTRKI